MRLNPGAHCEHTLLAQFTQFLTVHDTLQLVLVSVTLYPGLHCVQRPLSNLLHPVIDVDTHLPLVIFMAKPSTHHLHVPK